MKYAATCPLGHQWETTVRMVTVQPRFQEGKRRKKPWQELTADIDNCPTCHCRRGVMRPILNTTNHKETTTSKGRS